MKTGCTYGYQNTIEEEVKCLPKCSYKHQKALWLEQSTRKSSTRDQRQQFNKSNLLLPYVEITHLNKVIRVVPYSWTAQDRLKTLLDLTIEHCSIRMDRMEYACLIHAPTGEIIESDNGLRPSQAYFIAFMKRGEEAELEDTPLYGKPLFWREGRSFTIKRMIHYEKGYVQDLHLHQSCGNPKGFRCPVFQCGNHFKKSCDLKQGVFNIQTGSNPYRCHKCGQGFRRNILLKTHVANKRCAFLRKKKAQLPGAIQQEASFQPRSHLEPRTSGQAFSNLTSINNLSTAPMIQKYQSQSLTNEISTQIRLALQISQILKNYGCLMQLVKKIAEGRSPEEITEARLAVCHHICATLKLLV